MQLRDIAIAEIKKLFYFFTSSLRVYLQFRIIISVPDDKNLRISVTAKISKKKFTTFHINWCNSADNERNYERAKGEV